MSETKEVLTTRAVYRNGIYYEAGRRLTVGVKEKCKAWRDVEAPAPSSGPLSTAAKPAPAVAPATGKRPSDRDL